MRIQNYSIASVSMLKGSICQTFLFALFVKSRRKLDRTYVFSSYVTKSFLRNLSHHRSMSWAHGNKAHPGPLQAYTPRARTVLSLARGDNCATAAALRQAPRSPPAPSPATNEHPQVRAPLILPSCCAKPSSPTLA